MLSRRRLILLAAPVFVIESGREQEIVALFSPVSLGGEVTPGWRLMNVRVQQTFIEIEIQGTDQSAFVRLDHRDAVADASERTPSFSVTRGDNAKDGPGGEAASKVVALLRQNDRGGFWKQIGTDPSAPPAPAPARRRGVVVPAIVAGVVVALIAALYVRKRRQRRPDPPK